MLEIGAGCCGVGGIAFAMLGARHVTLTDGDVAAVELLRSNLASVKAQLLPHTPLPDIECATFRWGSDEPSDALAPPYDIIVGTDVVSGGDDLNRVDALADTLAVLSHARTVLLLALQWRGNARLDHFHSLLQGAGFRVEILSAPRWTRDQERGGNAQAGIGIDARALDEQAPITVWRCTRAYRKTRQLLNAS